ncbi:MAG: nucleotidyltransferase domain-containing protein [bacterium]|nr:nucleotidyltransferase domain-containing protein [bacterium]
MLDFKSKITEKLLSYYFVNTGAEHYINELARELSLDPGNLDRKLKELEKEGILISRLIGNQRHYSLNRGYPLLNELKKLYNLKYGLENRITALLKNLAGLKDAYIFGSYANNKFGSGSDIDIFLIGSHSSIEAKRLLVKTAKEFKREFNIIDLTEEEFKKRKKAKNELIANIFSHKIIKLI